MNSTERERVVKDLVNHHIESIEQGSGDEAEHDEIEDFESEVRSLSDDQLENWWMGNVAEWISPMSRWDRAEYHTEDGPIWEQEGYDTVADWQYDKLLETGDPDYGYISFKYDLPYQ